jgi:hypothetical protein
MLVMRFARSGCHSFFLSFSLSLTHWCAGEQRSAFCHAGLTHIIKSGGLQKQDEPLIVLLVAADAAAAARRCNNGDRFGATHKSDGQMDGRTTRRIWTGASEKDAGVLITIFKHPREIHTG